MGEGFPGVAEVVAAIGKAAELAGGGGGVVGEEISETGDFIGSGVVPVRDGVAGLVVDKGVESGGDAAGSEAAEGGSVDEGRVRRGWWDGIGRRRW